MSELVNTNQNSIHARLYLLATVSAVALLGVSYSLGEALAASDTDRPTVWIELGGQLSRLDDGQDAFEPTFPVSRPSIFSPSQEFERSPRYSTDEVGKLSFEPVGSAWVFSASVQYGRSSAKSDVRQQTNPKPGYTTNAGVRVTGAAPAFPIASKFADTNAQTSENHLILDFQVGKDVGLGMFGSHRGSSILNLGVRFAQFSTKSNIAIKSDPDWRFDYKYFPNGARVPKYQTYHTNRANLEAARSFHGVGPSLSWDASAPLVGTSEDSELTFDWGVNASLLFGRQRAKIHHDTQAQYHPHNRSAGYRLVTYNPTPVNVARSRSVTVPNIGGFAGLSFRYANAKISAGYRTDFFFGAMDGGIDARHTRTVGFYGPFATISIGLP